MEPYVYPSVVPRPVLDVSPVGLRVLQYLVDGFLTTAGAMVLALGVVLLPFAGIEGTVADVLGVLLVVAILGWFGVYWVWLPVRLAGQTPAMRWFGLRVVSLETGLPASAGQHGLRLLGLVTVDGIASGLVGLGVMTLTERRQRVGDLLARAAVVRA